MKLLLNRFKNSDYFELALIHRSFPFKNTKLDPTGHNERLEFVGDAVLGLVVAAELAQRFYDSDEGVLSQMRSSLVNESALAEIAKDLSLSEDLKMSFQEEKNGGREKSRILASAFEAVVGALYLDSGFEVAKAFIIEVYETKWPKSEIRQSWDKDYKTQLQEMSQKISKTCPSYSLLDEAGPDHEKIFKIEVEVMNKSFMAKAASKKQAEQLAAQKAISYFLEQQGQ
jgi:ribonuclease III